MCTSSHFEFAIARSRRSRCRDRGSDAAGWCRRRFALDARGVEPDPASVAGSLTELLAAESATVLEVSRLETTHATVTDVLSSGDANEVSPDLVAAAERCNAAAATGTRRLVEAVRAVADIGGRTAVDAAIGTRVSQLTRELTLDAGSREAALRDVDALLAR